MNQAVRNNPDKFPSGYIYELIKEEVKDLRSKTLTTNLAISRVKPKAFTEKGLYMLATILKGKKATETTIEKIKPSRKSGNSREQLRSLQKLVTRRNRKP